MSSVATTTGTAAKQQQQQQQVVQTLLGSHHNKYHIEWNGYFSNHLPHGVIALYNMNAPAERIEAFAQKYSRYLTPPKQEDISPAHAYSVEPAEASRADAENKITDANFRLHLGKRQYFLQYFQYFQEQFGKNRSEEHRDAIVARYFALLSHGSLHSLLHPLIHLGWSLSLPAELSVNTTIEGLAYCAFSYFAYDQQVSADDSKTVCFETKPLTVTQMLFQSQAYLSPYVGAIKPGIAKTPYREMGIGEFQESVVFVSQHHGRFLRECSNRLAVPSDRRSMLSMLNHMLDVALVAYAASNNDFFILHVCTGLLGVVHLASRLEDSQLADTIRLMSTGWMMMWMVQNHVGAKHKFMQALSQCASTQEEYQALLSVNEGLKMETQNLEWSALLEEGIRMDEEHTIKLVHVCHYRAQHGGELGALYKHVAKFRLEHPFYY